MATSLGDVFLALRGKYDEFLKDATKAGDQAGDKAATAFNKKLGAKVGLALTAALAAGAKGAIDLDNAVRQAGASMGLLESELAGFSSGVVALFKANPTKGFSEIADTVAALKTNMNLSVDAALAASQAYLNFSKVTGQTAPDAVRTLDDVLDAFALDATEGGRVMDLLVASQQKYGGVISENAGALATLAPQLRGLNGGLEDGVALLNLFQTTGLDASRATFALNTAVQKLKPGESLNGLIAQISSIVDPAQRAKAAVDFFGARGGVALANALRPGVTGLDDFKISATEAAGAVEQAGKTIDDKFQNQITKAFRTFIQGPLAELGPGILTALTSLGTLTTAFFTMGVTAKAAWASAIGPLVALTAPLAVLAAAVATLGAISKEAGKSVDDVATRALTATSEAANRIQDLNAQLSINAITLDDYNAAVAEVRRGMDEATSAIGRATAAYPANRRAVADLVAETKRYNDALRDKAMAPYIVDMGQLGSAADNLAGKFRAAAADFDTSTVEMIDDMAGLPVGAKGAVDEMAIWWSKVPKDIMQTAPKVYEAALAVALRVADAHEASRSAVNAALGNLRKDSVRHYSVQAEIADAGSILASTKMRNGLASKNQQIANDYRVLALALVGRLNALGITFFGLGEQAAQNLWRGFQRFSQSRKEGFREMFPGLIESADVVANPLNNLGSYTAVIEAAGGAIRNVDDDTSVWEATLDRLASTTDTAAAATRRGSSAAKEAAAAFKDQAGAVRDKLSAALRTAKDVALDYFRQVHDKNLQAIRVSAERTKREIDDARARIRAHLEEVRSTTTAPVTAAEQAQRAVEDARTLRDLQERLAEAQAGGDAKAVRSAEEALQSFGARAAIDALREQAQAAIAAAEEAAGKEEVALKAREAAADLAATNATTKENERYEAQKRNFDRSFDALTTYLTNTDTAHKNSQDRITKLYDAFGLTMEKVGKAVGDKFAAGLIASKAAVEKNAAELAQVIEDYLNTHSPAKAGPLRRTSPDQMGAGIVHTLTSGLLGAVPQWRAAVAKVAGLFALPTLPPVKLPPATRAAPAPEAGPERAIKAAIPAWPEPPALEWPEPPKLEWPVLPKLPQAWQAAVETLTGAFTRPTAEPAAVAPTAPVAQAAAQAPVAAAALAAPVAPVAEVADVARSAAVAAVAGIAAVAPAARAAPPADVAKVAPVAAVAAIPTIPPPVDLAPALAKIAAALDRKEPADVIRRYRKTDSPVEAGLLHRTSPEQMGADLVDQLVKGARSQFDAWRDTLAAAVSLPTLMASPTLAYGGAGAAAPMATSTTTYGDRNVNVTVNNPKPEPTSQSVEERLRIGALTGYYGEAA